jgi:hypothetical protein
VSVCVFGVVLKGGTGNKETGNKEIGNKKQGNRK